MENSCSFLMKASMVRLKFFRDFGLMAIISVFKFSDEPLF